MGGQQSKKRKNLRCSSGYLCLNRSPIPPYPTAYWGSVFSFFTPLTVNFKNICTKKGQSVLEGNEKMDCLFVYTNIVDIFVKNCYENSKT